MADYDIHIKGGTVVDGTRAPRYQGDVWIRDGKVAQIGGRSPGFAKKTIDADGLIVAPGFVDLHTHYDAQIRWDPYCTISGWHGVTSLVLGNCGFGFAPCKPEFRERSMLTMTRTEAIPYSAMKEGMHWDWETIPEYMDSLDRAPKGVNCIQYMPTASLMTYVMGLEAAKTRVATEKERLEMARLLDEGMDAGLCGFSIQRLGTNSVQADFDGSPMVTDTMCDEDILNLARVLRARDEGFIEITQATGARQAAIRHFVEELWRRSPGVRSCFRPITSEPATIPKSIATACAGCTTRAPRACRSSARAATVRSGFAFTLEHWNLYDVAARRGANLTTGTTRRENRQDARSGDARGGSKRPRRRCARLDVNAGRRRRTAAEALIVQWVENQAGTREVRRQVARTNRRGRGQASDRRDARSVARDRSEGRVPAARIAASTPNTWPRSSTTRTFTFPGVSDGGAHTKFFTGGAFTTDFLRWLVRDEQKITLEEAHYRLSALPAHAAGFAIAARCARVPQPTSWFTT